MDPTLAQPVTDIGTSQAARSYAAIRSFLDAKRLSDISTLRTPRTMLFTLRENMPKVQGSGLYVRTPFGQFSDLDVRAADNAYMGVLEFMVGDKREARRLLDAIKSNIAVGKYDLFVSGFEARIKNEYEAKRQNAAPIFVRNEVVVQVGHEKSGNIDENVGIAILSAMLGDKEFAWRILSSICINVPHGPNGLFRWGIRQPYCPDTHESPYAHALVGILYAVLGEPRVAEQMFDILHEKLWHSKTGMYRRAPGHRDYPKNMLHEDSMHNTLIMTVFALVLGRRKHGERLMRQFYIQNKPTENGLYDAENFINQEHTTLDHNALVGIAFALLGGAELKAAEPKPSGSATVKKKQEIENNEIKKPSQTTLEDFTLPRR